MRKFLLKVSLFGLYALLAQIVLPMILDPFNVFHVYSIRATGIEPNRHYIKMTYILDNPDKFDGYVFGSSRVGAIHTDKMPGKIYNMTYSVGLPSEHLANIKTFAAHNIRPSRVFIGIDGIAINADPKTHLTDAMRCPYEYLDASRFYFYEMYLDPSMVLRSLKIKPKPSDRNSLKEFYSFGWQYDYGIESSFDWDSVSYTPYIKTDGYDENVNRAINTIHELVDVCREHGIELFLFTNPLYKTTYLQDINIGYLNLLEGIAAFTDFYNFSGLNDVTLNNNNYYETSHYKAEVGDLIMNVICSGEIYPELYSQGFGVKVTKDNARDFMFMLRRQAKGFIENSIIYDYH